MIETQKHIRKPLYVDAVRVTNANFHEIAAWCQGEIELDAVSDRGMSKSYIKVRVHNPKNVRQTQAFVGDWLLYTERGYKVYTNKAFHASFDPVEGVEPKLEQELPTRLGNVSSTPEEKDQRAVSQLDVPLSEDEEIEVQAEEESLEPPVADTRQVISEADQQAMDPEELRELLKSGEYVLAQDLAA